MVPRFRCLAFFEISGFITCRKNRSNSVLVFYGALNFRFYRGFARLLLHISVFSLVTSANSVFIGNFRQLELRPKR